jgi:hypothetical protein
VWNQGPRIFRVSWGADDNDDEGDDGVDDNIM